jgi:hypothetical protein
MKSKAAICYKLRDKRFFIKGIPNSVLDLQDNLDEHDPEYKPKTRGQKLNKSTGVKLLDPWINVPPQTPY